MHVVDCNTSLLSCYTSINLTQSQKPSDITPPVTFVDATISTNQHDLDALTVFLLDPAGSIYYICPLLLKNMMVTQDLMDTINSRKECQELQKLLLHSNFVESKLSSP